MEISVRRPLSRGMTHSKMRKTPKRIWYLTTAGTGVYQHDAAEALEAMKTQGSDSTFAQMASAVERENHLTPCRGGNQKTLSRFFAIVRICFLSAPV